MRTRGEKTAPSSRNLLLRRLLAGVRNVHRFELPPAAQLRRIAVGVAALRVVQASEDVLTDLVARAVLRDRLVLFAPPRIRRMTEGTGDAPGCIAGGGRGLFSRREPNECRESGEGD